MPAKPQYGLSKADAQKIVIAAIAKGSTVEAAMNAVDRTLKTYENWRATDEAFRNEVDRIRGIRQRNAASGKAKLNESVVIPFAEFRRQYLGNETYPHMQAWIDILEGKPYTPREGERYHEGRPNRVLINTPPFHAKSATITVDYATYRLAMNPNMRIIIVSKTQAQAKKFLYGIEKRLTSSQYAELQAAYAPVGGFRGEGSDRGQWTADKFYIGSHMREVREKDPSVEALGMGGHIYGARADLIILDDCVTLSNAGEYEKQRDWINQEVASRLGPNGKLLVVGTRVATTDLYSELLNGDNYLSGKSPWTYLSQPAVLAYAEDPKDWRTLWPKSTRPLEEEGYAPDEDGMYPAWDGPALAAVRESIAPRTWQLVYMQQQVAEDAIFHPAAVRGCVNGQRTPGPLVPGAFGHPRRGMEGMYVIASMDPAMTGDTFALVMAVDRQTNKRWLLNAWVQASPTPTWIRELIFRVTEEYGVNEWVIEKNAFQLFLIQDPQVTEFLRNRGVRLHPHYTSTNKADPDFGVASVAPLFGTVKRNHDGAGKEVYQSDGLISIPRVDGNEGLKALVEQLITWQPGKLGRDLKQDGPMALWFAELRAREALGFGRQQAPRHFMHNPYLTRADKKRQMVVPLELYSDSLG